MAPKPVKKPVTIGNHERPVGNFGVSKARINTATTAPISPPIIALMTLIEDLLCRLVKSLADTKGAVSHVKIIMVLSCEVKSPVKLAGELQIRFS